MIDVHIVSVIRISEPIVVYRVSHIDQYNVSGPICQA